MNHGVPPRGNFSDAGRSQYPQYPPYPPQYGLYGSNFRHNVQRPKRKKNTLIFVTIAIIAVVIMAYFILMPRVEVYYNDMRVGDHLIVHSTDHIVLAVRSEKPLQFSLSPAAPGVSTWNGYMMAIERRDNYYLVAIGQLMPTQPGTTLYIFNSDGDRVIRKIYIEFVTDSVTRQSSGRTHSGSTSIQWELVRPIDLTIVSPTKDNSMGYIPFRIVGDVSGEELIIQLFDSNAIAEMSYVTDINQKIIYERMNAYTIVLTLNEGDALSTGVGTYEGFIVLKFRRMWEGDKTIKLTFTIGNKSIERRIVARAP